MRFTLHRDQAVWECETLLVTIPDDTPEDDQEDAITDALQAGNYESIGEPTILDSVESFDTQISDIEDIFYTEE